MNAIKQNTMGANVRPSVASVGLSGHAPRIVPEHVHSSPTNDSGNGYYGVVSKTSSVERCTPRLTAMVSPVSRKDEKNDSIGDKDTRGTLCP